MHNLDLTDFSSPIAKVKYGACKKAVKLSKEDPKSLYPDIEFFTNLLSSDKNIVIWTAIMIIGNLSVADTENKIDVLIPKLFVFFHSPRMITSVNTIAALIQIAKNKPKHEGKILKELLKVEGMAYINKGEESPECRNIAIGAVLDGMNILGDDVLSRPEVIAFVEEQINNTRPSVARKAKILQLKICKS